MVVGYAVKETAILPKGIEDPTLSHPPIIADCHLVYVEL
jgi:hypothetical protein